jgi:ribosome-associated toxin RatA of RatAB toxin-antitoxin module
LIVERSIQLPYTREQLFSLVSDIGQYPRFLPYCQDAKILSRQGSTVQGTLRIGYKGLGYSFATKNIEQAPGQIRMQLLSGPFQRLEGDWLFEALPQGGTRVHLRLDIVLKPAVLGILFKSKIDDMTDLMVASFVQRAKDLYAQG